MESEDRTFQEYHERPTRESLVALLRAHQASVYNLCFQVLRNPHDAEDAAQEVLLEVIRGAGRIREPRAFKRWLCRAALHTALDHLRRRARRSRLEEKRAAMTQDNPDRAVDALHEAMARLDDEDRCLLVEKYFDQATLEQMAAREGLSTAAVWKRIERARDRLKRLMAGAGMSVAAPGLDSMLESLRPVPPPDLITGSLSVKAALANFGGVVMGTKALISGTTIVVALIFLTIGAGSGYVVGSKRSGGVQPPVNSSGRSPKPGLNSGSARSSSPPPAGKLEAAAIADSVPAAPEANPLLARLERFKAWRAASDKKPLRTPQDHERRFFLLKEELDGVRELILSDPAGFLAWVDRRENGLLLEDAFNATLVVKQTLYSVQVQEFTDPPSSLTDGLLKLLQSGRVEQRRAVMGLAQYLKNPPPEFRAMYVSLLAESYDPGVGPMAVNALLFSNEPAPSELEAVVRYAMQLKEDAVRHEVFRSLGKVPKTETREWLLQTLESGQFADSERLAYCALEWWTYPSNSPGRDFEERAARILGAAMARTKEQDPYFMSMYTALNLPTEISLRLVEQAATGAPNSALRNAAEAVLQRAKKPGASPRILQEAWMAEFRQK
ncbi:MAG TPA: sigma-70 family RNA polymerase sigma factor [Planctomycetota bacterium]|nr:sigma-70 family RNA polymerase sigma factor [Planctomycetota bacterium]